MTPLKYSCLISSLREKTLQNKCFWNRTSAKDQYKLILDSLMIVLSRIETGQKRIFRLDFYGDNNQIVDSLSANESDFPFFSELLNLFNAIEKSKEEIINRVMNNVLDEIKNKDSIGKVEEETTKR